MSAACFTCSRTTGTVPLFTNTCYWDILRSLLTPDDINIDHVCFPSPNLRLCTKCKKVLLSISEFRNIAVNSVRTQLEQWHQDMDPLGIVKMETENVDIKQEIINEDPVCDKERERASLHEEVMLESPEDTMGQIKLEPETLITEDDQNELDSYLDDASNSHEDGAGSDENLDRKIKSDPENETTDPVTTRSRRKEKNPEPSTSISTEHTQTRKRNSLPERPPTNAKKAKTTERGAERERLTAAHEMTETHTEKDERETTQQNAVSTKHHSCVADKPCIRPSSVLDAPHIRPSSVAGAPQIRPSSVAGAPQIRPSSVLDAPQIRPSSVAGAPQIRPSSVAGAPQIRPSSVLDMKQIRPSGVPDIQVIRSTSVADIPQGRPSSVADAPQIRPSRVDTQRIRPVCVVNASPVRPSSALGRPQIRPSNVLNRPQIRPSSVLNRPQIHSNSLLNRTQIRRSGVADATQIRPSNIADSEANTAPDEVREREDSIDTDYSTDSDEETLESSDESDEREEFNDFMEFVDFMKFFYSIRR